MKKNCMARQTVLYMQEEMIGLQVSIYIFSNSYRKMRTIITNALLNSNELLFLLVLTYLAGKKYIVEANP